MVPHGYGSKAPFVLVTINEDGSLGWLLPLESYTDSYPNPLLGSVKLLNGQEIFIKGGEMYEVAPASKTWSEVAAEIKTVRDEQKRLALAARQELLLSLEAAEIHTEA